MKKGKVIDLQEDIKNKENLLASQGVYFFEIKESHYPAGNDKKFE